MCNAYSITSTREAILEFARSVGLPTLPSDQAWQSWHPKYAVRPRNWIPIVRLDEGEAAWEIGAWDFIPPEGKSKFQLTNARDDKLVSGWPWKLVSKKQRLLVYADGFYEPEKPAGAKGTVPWRYYSMVDRRPFCFAAVGSRVQFADTDSYISTVAIVTTSANAAIHIHDRMPVILEPADYGRWLEPGDVPTDLLRPYPADQMQGWRVTDAARSSRSPDSPDLIAPVDQPSLI